MTSPTPDEAAEANAYRHQFFWGALPMGFVEATGSDAVRFVDNFTTASVSGFAVGGGGESFFTDGRGWVIALATILRTDSGLLVCTPPGLAATLCEHLEHYHIREKVDLRDASAEIACLLVTGPAAKAGLSDGGKIPPPQDAATADPSLKTGMESFSCGPLGPLCEQPLPTVGAGHLTTSLGGIEVRIVCTLGQGADGYWILVARDRLHELAVKLTDAGLPQVDETTLETLRIEARYPSVADILAKTLPQELGRDARAISFTKGCYLGQETVARLDAMGHVNRRLVLLAIDAAAPLAVPVPILQGDTEVGIVTSASHAPNSGGLAGLGLVQVKALASDQLTVGGKAARVVAEEDVR